MVPPFVAILHAGHGQELPLLAYLYRVVLHLLALGGITVLAFWTSNAVAAVRSPSSSGRGSDGNRSRGR